MLWTPFIRNCFFPGLFFLGLSFQVMAQQVTLPMNALFGRKYKIGDVYRYKMTLSESHNGQLAFTNIAVCELTVIDSAGVPYDEVRWIMKKVINPKDSVDQTAKAVLVTPYRISLDGKGKIDIPKILVPEMTEPIQDFNTFFVAVSPFILGTDRLKKKGDSTTTAKPIVANFANGTSILKGEDCLLINITLRDLSKQEAFIYSSFAPPMQNGLVYLTTDMNKPVVDSIPNNFQMVAPAGKDLVMLNYGREYFYINSTVRKSDGKIVKADMYNQLNLKIKVNCNNEYKNCQVEVPFAETRTLTLELLQ